MTKLDNELYLRLTIDRLNILRSKFDYDTIERRMIDRCVELINAVDFDKK